VRKTDEHFSVIHDELIEYVFVPQPPKRERGQPATSTFFVSDIFPIIRVVLLNRRRRIFHFLQQAIGECFINDEERFFRCDVL
tara:strand:- start:96 stop:344 length:249 start_codon:yes stop_codon:yes gene_type:complete